MPSTLNNLLWHDGNLTRIAFSIDRKGKSSVTLSVFLYLDENAPDRRPYQVECQGVSRFNCTLDTAELKDNMSAGNISNAYLKNTTLWLYFTDGMLEVHAKKFRLRES